MIYFNYSGYLVNSILVNSFDLRALTRQHWMNTDLVTGKNENLTCNLIESFGEEHIHTSRDSVDFLLLNFGEFDSSLLLKVVYQRLDFFGSLGIFLNQRKALLLSHALFIRGLYFHLSDFVPLLAEYLSLMLEENLHLLDKGQDDLRMRKLHRLFGVVGQDICTVVDDDMCIQHVYL